MKCKCLSLQNDKNVFQVNRRQIQIISNCTGGKVDQNVTVHTLRALLHVDASPSSIGHIHMLT